MKTEEEKRQMAEKHRFKKNREFKQRLDEQEQNEESDIRSFTFHRHEFKDDDRSGKQRERRQPRRERHDADERKPKYKSTPNRGGHERFDRSGGKKNFKRDHDHDDD